ncbi:hypothetical protein OPT61_g9722 [Boeremia exigua]|uniref:Uncharacterized protein n=1 Tax=Boeremia exigua TaxID=749465 RepID=A0ACC2HTP3_9PLEO|nr:hypothetical protein OPT61_g9722 [Boeremia exigua]
MPARASLIVQSYIPFPYAKRPNQQSGDKTVYKPNANPNANAALMQQNFRLSTRCFQSSFRRPPQLSRPIRCLVANRSIIQSNTHRASVVSIVLANDTLAAQLPQASVVIAARGDEVGRVGAERAVPDPALVAMKGSLKGEGGGVAFSGRGERVAGLHVVWGGQVDGPDAAGVVGGAGGEVTNVGGEQDARDISMLGRYNASCCTYGVVPGAHHAAVAGNGDTGDRYVVLWDQLVAALVLAEVPDAHIAAAVAADQLALVGVDDDVVDGDAVGIVALDIATAGVPNLDRAVLARGDQPLGLAVEGDACDVAGVAIEGQDRVGVGRLDVVKLHRVVTSSGEVPFVGRDAEAIDLRVGVWDRAGANAREGLPEAGRGQSGVCRGRVRADRIVWS